MAGHLGTDLQNAFLDWFKGTTFGEAAPTTLYIALGTTNPSNDDGTGFVEVTTVGTAYARQPITAATDWSTITNTALAGSTIDNTAVPTWTTATAPWGTVTCAALVNTASGAFTKFWGWQALTGGSQVVPTGATFDMPASDIVIGIK
jgi:hypothetical protein